MPQSLVQNIQHTIFSTRDRCRWIDESWEKILFKQIGGILETLGCTLIVVGAYYDHRHLLSMVDRKLSIPEFVSKVKSASSFWIHKEIPGRKNSAWQRGYSSFSVSRSNIPEVKKYIQSQHAYHCRQGFQDELTRISHQLTTEAAHTSVLTWN